MDRKYVATEADRRPAPGWHPRDPGRALVLAVNRGVPFVISHRDSQVAKDIFTLADKLSGASEAAAAAAGSPQKAAPKQGRRLFGGAS